jgi:hypothetical protein
VKISLRYHVMSEESRSNRQIHKTSVHCVLVVFISTRGAVLVTINLEVFIQMKVSAKSIEINRTAY